MKPKTQKNIREVRNWVYKIQGVLTQRKRELFIIQFGWCGIFDRCICRDRVLWLRGTKLAVDYVSLEPLDLVGYDVCTRTFDFQILI